MSRYEKDKLIAEKVLRFDCFSKELGNQWYERHHKMGFWNYSSNLKNTDELIAFLAKQAIQSIIYIKSPDNYYCKFFTNNDRNKNSSFQFGETLQDAVCKASLKFFEIDVVDE